MTVLEEEKTEIQLENEQILEDLKGHKLGKEGIVHVNEPKISSEYLFLKGCLL